jgi:hypothetical protein
MSLKDIYEKAYGGTEKTAEDVLARILGEGEDEQRSEKLANAYDELGRSLARETFASEVLGREKTASDSVLEEIFGEESAEEEAPEKTAADEVLSEIFGEDGDDLDKQAADFEVKLATIDKEAALAFKLIKEAAKGGKKALGLLGRITGAAKKGGKKAMKFLRKGYEAVKAAPGAVQKGMKGAYRAVKRHPAIAGGGAGAGLALGLGGGYAAGKSGKKEK